MTAKQIKLWLIALGFAIVAGKLIWTTYLDMSQQRCVNGGRVWDGETRTCQTAAP